MMIKQGYDCNDDDWNEVSDDDDKYVNVMITN
jgi:hypothetical protein